ncbi:sigma 54-interacting transcriptional regulator [Salisediminibacterium halotolerans]|uniref:sigma 54-interacting transcriptional regulator n=1 Tax=Salisediminibacterium halotolerans TaxID=517425 RepID=UPI000EB0D0DF|nr:sigma 54-interacting transcriptional regulator [Salisediminibacterium halotolerans]RLJ78288.1 PAS domain S-box-containing protein [Actinophytocola xinjiangensis]RPE88373.1 PAS domain S-box-containing protein [Salisediminibacterium halotolerans]TWG37265.1 PAS domain S-box-containing protein [Salisediminibacterium halotolerans]GEL07745.1 ATPase AAA [Salisediminibacterium halotolerans]
MSNNLLLVTGNKKTKSTLKQQLAMLLGDRLEIESLAIDEDLSAASLTPYKVILFSSQSVRTEFTQRYKFPDNTLCITGKRTIDPEAFPTLLSLQEGKVLIVNDADESIRETAESIYQLGITHLEFVPYHPGTLYYDGIRTAVTPSETERCPASLTNVVDIGVRPFDMATVLKIVDYFQLGEDTAANMSERYLQRLVTLHDDLLTKEDHTQKISDHYHELLNMVDDGIIAYDQKEIVTAANRGAEKILLQSAQELIDQPVSSCVTHPELLEFLKNNETSGFLKNGEQEYVLSKTTTSSFQSTVVTMKSVEKAFEVEQTAKNQNKKKGLASKYSFSDIIGEHPEIIDTKDTALKMAAAEQPVLIYGETGVGKELFAHAIHLNSKRRNGPLFAINCSAMSENLFQSELFGYEEGTFTGALKGGKKGLFELASGGTLFLDEIGELSTDMQAQLLRVLQENEIRKIGGNSNIPVDVRIIAATNKSLENEVANNSFRADLFYRLHVLHMTVPPLKDRRSDLPRLTDSFLQKEKTGYQLDDDALELLMNYHWPGNIRELKNALDYAKTLSKSYTLKAEHLPPSVHNPDRRTQSESAKQPLTPELIAILKMLGEASKKGERLSLQQLADQSAKRGINFSKQQMRRRIQTLADLGLVEKGTGRIGSAITADGVKQIKNG